MDKNKLVSRFIIGTFVSLYALVSIVSTIHVIDFFELSNPTWLAITLAIGFEIGAAASLASLIILDKMNKTIVWALFLTITAMQMQGNMYYAFLNLDDYYGWVELFNLVEWEPLAQKRLLSFVSGAILPLVALGFIKSLVDYIKPESELVELTDSELGDIASDINSPSQTEEEEWDEDHALDMVMNDMVKDLDDADLEIEATESEIKEIEVVIEEVEAKKKAGLTEPIKEDRTIKPAPKKFGRRGPLYNARSTKNSRIAEDDE